MMLSTLSRFAPRFAAVAALLLGSAGLAAAAHHESDDAHEHAAMAPVGFKAIVVLVEGNDSGVSGTVTFEQTEKGVRVVADVHGLTPGKHGFHVHQKGDLSAANLTSTGGHYNPEGHDHAGPQAAMRHVGDLGNLDANDAGHATVDFIDSKLALTGDHSIIGRAVIIHAGEDDLTSQPTGAAGARVAGGVIGVIGVE